MGAFLNQVFGGLVGEVQIKQSAVDGDIRWSATQNVIGKRRAVNLNSTADQVIDIYAQNYRITDILLTNVSTTLGAGLTAGGVYTAASKAGTAIVSAAQVYTALTAASSLLPLTLGVGATQSVRSETQLFLSIYILGYSLV
jgi:hypothetical protein